MQKINQIIGSIILFAVCSLPAVFAQTKAVDSDVSGFIQESVLKINRTNFRLISDYEYKMRRTINSRDGKTTSTLFESYFPSRLKKQGANGGVIIVLEENGVAIPAKKIEKQRREAGKNLEKAGNASDEKSTLLENKREMGLPLEWTYAVAVGLTAFLEVCEFNRPRREIIDGRETISLNFDECKIGKLPVNKSYMANLQGVVLFDALDKAPIRLEAWRKSSSTNDAQGAPKVLLLFEQKRVAEGVWFPALIRVEGIGNEIVFPNLKTNWQTEFFDYKLPETEIKDVKINPK